MMEATMLTMFILWDIFKNKWMWGIAAILVVATLVSPSARQYPIYLLLLFLPGFLCVWAFASLYMRQLENEENYIQQGALAAWSAFQGDVSGAADQAMEAFRPGWFAMSFYYLSTVFLYPAMAALMATVVTLIIGQVFG